MADNVASKPSAACPLSDLKTTNMFGPDEVMGAGRDVPKCRFGCAVTRPPSYTITWSANSDVLNEVKSMRIRICSCWAVIFQLQFMFRVYSPGPSLIATGVKPSVNASIPLHRVCCDVTAGGCDGELLTVNRNALAGVGSCDGCSEGRKVGNDVVGNDVGDEEGGQVAPGLGAFVWTKGRGNDGWLEGGAVVALALVGGRVGTLVTLADVGDHVAAPRADNFAVNPLP